MSRLARFPSDPLARFRLISVWFAAALAFLAAGLIAFDSTLPGALKTGGALAAATLGVWWLYGHSLREFPVAGWLVDLLLLLVVALLSPMPSNSVALFFGGLQLRALYVSRRQIGLMIGSYAIARVASVALTYANGQLLYRAFPATAIISVVGLTVIAMSVYLFASATEQHVAVTRELARAEERYRLVARVTRDVVYDWNVLTNEIEWTESMHTVFGYSPEQIGGAAWWFERVHPADRDALARDVAAVVDDRAATTGNVHYRVRRADGRFADVSGSMIVHRKSDGTAERVIGSIRDMTSERLLEERLRQAQKMEAVGQLAGGVAHDFNNLLTVIGGHVYMLETGLLNGVRRPADSDAFAAKHLSGIGRAADRAASLTRQLVAFGKKQLLAPTVVDLNAVVDDVLGMMRPTLDQRITIDTRLEPNLWPVHADAGQLGQVLVNLLLNARDAMHVVGGTLSVESSNQTLDDGVEMRRGQYVRLVVRDTGVGMDAATLARAFEPFFTTKPAGLGTGLGLATVYGIVEQSLGDIHAESFPGAGSTFTIHLPVAPAEHGLTDEPTTAVPERTWTTAARGRGILLVEDDAGVREFAAAVLAHAGHSVYVARNGVAGLEQMRKHGESITILVTDVVMPEMGGRALADRLRKERPELPVLYITGYTDDALLLDELKSTGARLLEKPFTARALEEAVALLGERVMEAAASLAAS
jgi:two-component system, cell cycle sensor histidine kinase and response regulator CckA